MVIGTADGSLAKTNKAKLLDAIEKETVDSSVNELPNDCVRVYDGMVIIRQTPSTSLGTFGDISKYVLERITSGQNKFIYFFICACLVIFFYFLQSDWL